MDETSHDTPENEDGEPPVNAARIAQLEKLVKDSEMIGKVLIRRDLELTRANDKLHELNEAKSNFVSVAAHQLRTPLSAIKWVFYMALSGDLGVLTDDQKTFLTKGRDSTDRMIALVNDMLSTDRIESGKTKYRFVPADITDTMDDVLYDFLPEIQVRKIRIALNYKKKTIPKVNIDPEKMWTVLQNLIENAVKYTINEGSITITIREEAGKAHVSVEDSGIGVPKEQQKNLFERFFRAKNAVKLDSSGSGLGLYITKNIVEKHGGTIWFEEKNPGSAFHFTIPTLQG